MDSNCWISKQHIINHENLALWEIFVSIVKIDTLLKVVRQLALSVWC